MDFYTVVQLGDATIRMAIPLLLACLAGLFSERAGIFDIGLEGKMLAAAFMAAAVSAYFVYNPTGGFVLGEVCNARGTCREAMLGNNFIAPAWIGLFAGIVTAVLLSVLHGFASITFRGNQLISGVAINFLAAGLTVVLAQAWFGQAGRTPALTGQCPREGQEVGLTCAEGGILTGGRFEDIDLPGALTSIREIRGAEPGLQFYSEFISGHSILVYLGLLCVPLTWWVLYRTRFGLRLRAVGENPSAVDTAGISVVRLRYSAVIICGVLCGIAGAYLSTAVQSGFGKDMTANRGFIALAALIFAKWRPWYALGACLLFGLFFAIENRFPNIRIAAIWLVPALIFMAALLTAYAARRERIDLIVLGALSALLVGLALLTWGSVWQASEVGLFASLWETVKLPSQFIASLPYILTVVVLAGFVGKAIPPRAGGQPYVKEQ